MRKVQVKKINEFAQLIHQILRSDRDVNIAVSGFTGEGKSCFSTILEKEYSKIAKVPWDFTHLTWERDEMMIWIDGDKKKKTNKHDETLLPGQKPEYSAILPDELFHMFGRKNWYEQGQKDAITVFNQCRDRHLLVVGNQPNFWQLDGDFTSRIRFYIYIPKRGIAWVFEQENNPFAKDNWNLNENQKTYRKNKNPYKCPNYAFKIEYDDWTEQEKKEYYNIRNKKRHNSLKKNKKEENTENYKKIKEQRDKLIRELFYKDPKLKNVEVARLIEIDESVIRKARRNE